MEEILDFVSFTGRQVGQATSDFTKQAYVVMHLIWVGRQVKNTQKTSDVICECYLEQWTIEQQHLITLSSPHFHSKQLKICSRNQWIEPDFFEIQTKPQWRHGAYVIVSLAAQRSGFFLQTYNEKKRVKSFRKL